MKRNLFLLVILLSFFGKAFSQPCPSPGFPMFQFFSTPLTFDTVGIWNNYPLSGSFKTYAGQERCTTYYSYCKTVLEVDLDDFGPWYYCDVFYKESQPTCTTSGYIKANSFFYSAYSNYRKYFLPVDSGKTYHIVIDYGFDGQVPMWITPMAYFGYHSIDSAKFTNLNSNSVTVSWDSYSHDVSVEYGPAGLPLLTAYSQSSPITITGLTPGTKYDFHLKKKCDGYVFATKDLSLKTPDCENGKILSCDNTVFGQAFTGELGSFSLSGCSICPMNSSQKFYRIIADTTGIYAINYISPKGTYTGKMGAYYKDASLGCNENNWNFIACETDHYQWSGNFGPLTAGHTYYFLLSSSDCLNYGAVSAPNNFKLTCPSPVCFAPASGLSSNANNNTVCSGKPVSLFPNGSMLSLTGLYKWYKDSCSGTPIGATKIITISPTVSKTYFLQITDTCGTFTCDSITITVNQTPVSSITGDSVTCLGVSTQWCAPAGLTSYLWSMGATTQCAALNTAASYTVTITGSNGCTNTSSKTLIVANPSCTITGSFGICPGNSTQWCAPAGLTSYLWSTGATTQCVTLSTIGNYTVTVTDANGCTNSCSKSVTVSSTPACSITGNTSVCGSGNVQWCAPAGLTYYWSTGTTTQCATFNQAGAYSLIVTNAGGCTSSCSQTFVVNANPTCSITGNASVCSGSSTQWCAPVGLTSYLWNTGATTQCINVSAVGNYTVTVTNASGCTSSCSKILAVNANPACSITGNTSVCFGNSTQWCAPSGLSSYLWNTGATTQCITVSATGYYTVTVTNAGGCTSSCSQILVLSGSIPTCTITGNSTICNGSSTQWCATAGMTSYSWSTGATSQCITVSAAGNYTVQITNASGCTCPCLKTLAVSGSAPTCSITGSGAICTGSSTQWCAPSGLTSYLWNTGATTQCITVSTAGNYTVTVTNASGCSSSCSQALVNGTAPVCSITGIGNVCPGSSTQWCAPAGLASYLWSTGGTTQCITLSTEGSYTVTVTNANGCTNSCSKTLGAAVAPTCNISGAQIVCSGSSNQWCATSGLASYLWSNGATTQCISLNIAGNYTVTVTKTNGCTSTCSKFATNTNLFCSITGNGAICSGSAHFCAPANLISYSWSTGATTQCITTSAVGIYTVTLTHADGCTASCTTSLAGTNPICLITGNGAICSGSSTQWCAPTGLASYLWNTGATTPCISVSTSGTYTVTVTDYGGCSNSCNKTLVVNPTPVCSITGNGGVCSGSSTQWCAPAGMASYSWSTGATTQCASIGGISGNYGVMVTNTAGCTSACQKTLTLSSNPPKPGTITAAGGNTKVCQGESKTYSISSVSGATSYIWTPPANAVVASGQGTTSATINFNSGFVTDSVKVAAINACGTGDYRALKITKGTIPAMPGIILGAVSGVCNTNGVSYLTNNVAGVTYNWTNSNTNFAVATGQGTSAITANFNSGYVTGTLTVTPTNGCGTGTARTLTVKGTPATPPVVGGATAVCANQHGVGYSIAPVTGATNYTWVGPTGSHINDGSVTSGGATLVTTATTITVNYGATAGNLKVRGNNNCGSGSYKTVAITFNCREAGATVLFDVSMFPNPADDELTVSFNSETQTNYSIEITDIIGKLLLLKNGMAEKGENNFILSLDEINPGVYFVEIKNGHNSRVLKLVVN
ncbi:MAG: T9SS type A sorting domain-containing protein [Bacteroidia bacterium]